MIKRSTMILIVVTAVIMVLGVAYAAMTSRDLNINGNLVADINQDNFLVKFLTETEVSDSAKVTAIVTSDTTATIAVQGLSAKGDTVTATYIVKNMSEDLSADLVLGVGNNNKEYFKVTAVLGKESLLAGEETTAVVTVELLKTLIISDQSAQMEVQIVATPIQPGNEGTTNVPAPEITIPEVMPSTEYTTPYLPSGFEMVAGTNLDTGLTIEDSVGNEYVWVEVPRSAEVYSTAGLNITEFTATEYEAIENDLHTYTTTYRKGTRYSDTHSGNDASTGLTSAQYTELKQKMLKSVYQNGGFYVGKYEAGIMDSYRDYQEDYSGSHPITETAVIQANAYPYNWVRCSQAQTLASNMESGEYTSSLMFGVQWDLMLKYLETKGATVAELNEDSTSWGNYYNSTYTIENSNAKYNMVYGDNEWLSATSYEHSNETALLTAGASTQFSKQNIYDIAGNVWEWTLEYTSYSSYPCAFRGGNCYSNGYFCPASSRNYDSTAFSNPNFGFRPSIY